MLNQKKLFLKIYKKINPILENNGKFKIPFSIKIQRFLFSKAKSNIVHIQGHKMFLDPNDSLNFSIDGIWEETLTNYVKKIIKEGDVVLDIGANMGYFTLIFAKLVGDKGKVFAFEPEPNNFSLLKKNVEVNGYTNVILENKGLSHENKITKLYLSKGNVGQHRIYKSKYTGEDFVLIKTTSIDNYFQKDPISEKISFIKMDVEGSEYGVLKGMKSLLDKNKPITIMLEFIPTCIREFGTNPKDLLNFLVEQHFEFNLINDEEKKIEKLTDLNFLLEKYDWDNPNSIQKEANLICKRK